MFWLKIEAEVYKGGIRSAVKSAALFLLGIALFLLLVYCGLFAAEKGVLELTALSNPAGILHCQLENNKMIIIFIGKTYRLCFEGINGYLRDIFDILHGFQIPG